MGSALAERFIAAGLDVLGFDIDPVRMAELRSAGGEPVESAVAVASRCRRILLSLPHSGVASEVLDEISPVLPSGAVIVDTTTGEPAQIAGFGERLAARGVQYLDATIGGSSKQVRAGEVIVICGGDRETFESCTALFACFSSNAFHVGSCGAGARMKLVLNLVLGLNRAVLAEGLCYAAACGINPAKALEILKAGPAYSRAMDVKGQKMLTGDFTPEARLSQHLKDVRLILATGAEAGARLPLSTLHEQLLREVEAAGFGAADNSAILKAFQKEPE